MLLKLTQSRVIFYLGLFLIIFLTYLNSLNNDFMMDDYDLILNDTKIHQFTTLHYQFIPDIKKNLQIENQQFASYYRPFAHILPGFGWALFKKNVVGYHMMNLILFYLAVLSLYHLLQQLFRNETLSKLTAIMFAVHPLNGLFINYITASVFGLQVMMLSLSFILFWKSIETTKRASLIIVSGLFFYMISLLCHETSLALPLYLLMSVLLLKKAFNKRIITHLIPYFLISSGFFFFRLQFASLNHNLFQKFNSPVINPSEIISANIELFTYFITKFFYFEGITLKYLLPVDEFKFNAISIVMVVAITVIMAICLVRRWMIYVWSLSLVLIGFLPVIFGSVFELRYGFLFEPHWVFFPSIGLFVFVTNGLLFLKSWMSPNFFVCLMTVIFLNMAFNSHHMNKLWGDEIAYSRYWLKHSPTQKEAYVYLATALQRKGAYEEAKKTYLQSLEGSWVDWIVYSNLGLMAKNESNFLMAEKYYLEALKLFPESTTVNNNLGLLFKQTQNYEQAKKHFQKAIKFNRFVLEPYINLANLHFQNNEYKEALAVYEKSLKFIDPNVDILWGQIIALFKLGYKEQFRLKAKQMIEGSLPSDLYVDLAIYLIQNAEKQLALQSFLKANEQSPRNIRVHLELGKFYANHEKYDQALDIWQEGLSIYPGHQDLSDLIHRVKQLQ